MSASVQFSALLPAVRAAARQPHAIDARLYTDGKRVKWLPRQLPGWYRLGAVVIKSLKEESCAA